ALGQRGHPLAGRRADTLRPGPRLPGPGRLPQPVHLYPGRALMAAPVTALVTGATGFVGWHLVRRLASEGWNVHVVTRPGSDLGRLGRLGLRSYPHDGTTEGI